MPTMQFISASLGVQCDFCHLEGAFEKDDKDPKKTARKMIQMVFALNKDSFEGKQKITCYACHRGARKPVIAPVITEENKTITAEIHPPPPSPLPAVDRILEKYLQAIGGSDKAGKITTRLQQGTLSVGSKNLSLEVLSKAPDKRVTIVHFPDGDSITGINGNEGWLSSPGHPVRDMSRPEADAALAEAAVFFASSLQTSFKEFKPLGTERIHEKETYVLSATHDDNSLPVQFYFESDSGLLVRMLQYTDTPLGPNPTQVDYADYREQDGVNTPFRWTVSRPGRQFTIQIERMQQNVSLEESKFHKPPSTAHP